MSRDRAASRNGAHGGSAPRRRVGTTRDWRASATRARCTCCATGRRHRRRHDPAAHRPHVPRRRRLRRGPRLPRRPRSRSRKRSGDAGEIAHTVNVMADQLLAARPAGRGASALRGSGAHGAHRGRRAARRDGRAESRRHRQHARRRRAGAEHYTDSLARYRGAEAARRSSRACSATSAWRTRASSVGSEAEAHVRRSRTCSRANAATRGRGSWSTSTAPPCSLRDATSTSARAVCERVLHEAGAVQETRLLAETYKHCGVIARETGRLDEAEATPPPAYEQATAREDLLLAAETAREQAELYLALGRNRETLQALSLSHRLFTQLRAGATWRTSRSGFASSRAASTISCGSGRSPSSRRTPTRSATASAWLTTRARSRRDMGFDETTMFWFRVGALLHDVGKIVVPSDILNKAGRAHDPRSGHRWSGTLRRASSCCATSSFRGTSSR